MPGRGLDWRHGVDALDLFAETRPFEPAGVVANPSQPILTVAAREG